MCAERRSEPGPGNPRAWAPLAEALADLAAGDASAVVAIESDDGVTQHVAAALFAEGSDALADAEALALGVCRGHVLDVGAGSGRHAIELQRAGARVRAIDVCPELVALMRARGVVDARVADVFDLREERFDTLLMMMNGIGIVGTLEGLDHFLAHARRLLRPGGQILFDSFDLRTSPDPRTARAIAVREASGIYFGEVTFRMSYSGRTGDRYPWLFLDGETAASRAEANGWHLQLLFEDEDSTYVARLLDALPAQR